MTYQNSPRNRTASIALSPGAPGSPLREQRNSPVVSDGDLYDDGFTLGTTEDIAWDVDSFDNISLDDTEQSMKSASSPGSANSSYEKVSIDGFATSNISKASISDSSS